MVNTVYFPIVYCFFHLSLNAVSWPFSPIVNLSPQYWICHLNPKKPSPILKYVPWPSAPLPLYWPGPQGVCVGARGPTSLPKAERQTHPLVSLCSLSSFSPLYVFLCLFLVHSHLSVSIQSWGPSGRSLITECLPVGRPTAGCGEQAHSPWGAGLGPGCISDFCTQQGLLPLGFSVTFPSGPEIVYSPCWLLTGNSTSLKMPNLYFSGRHGAGFAYQVTNHVTDILYPSYQLSEVGTIAVFILEMKKPRPERLRWTEGPSTEGGDRLWVRGSTV